MSPVTRLNPIERRVQILNAALEAARERQGYKHVERRDIAERIGVSLSLVSYYLGDVDTMRAAILAHAVATGAADVLLYGLVDRHPVAMGAPERLKREATGLIRSK